MGNMLPAHTASGTSACACVWPSVHRTDNCVFVAVPFKRDTTEQRQLIFVPLLGCDGNVNTSGLCQCYPQTCVSVSCSGSGIRCAFSSAWQGLCSGSVFCSVSP